MPTLTKSEQARINGAKSKGPVTAEGKKRSSLNAVRHGILAKNICLTMEQPEEYQKLLQDFLTRFQPADGVEMRLVEEMANCAWRLERCHAMETALFDNEMDTMQKQIKEQYKRIDLPTVFALGFKSLADNSKSLALYLRYEAAIVRQMERLQKLLESIKANVPPPDPTPEEEPITEQTQPEPNEPTEAPETNDREPIHRE